VRCEGECGGDSVWSASADPVRCEALSRESLRGDLGEERVRLVDLRNKVHQAIGRALIADLLDLGGEGLEPRIELGLQFDRGGEDPPRGLRIDVPPPSLDVHFLALVRFERCERGHLTRGGSPKWDAPFPSVTRWASVPRNPG
jgi:hypothetical protein